MSMTSIMRSTLERELYSDRAELARCLAMPDDSNRLRALCALASKLGASTISPSKGHGDASQPEVVHSIHTALQTKAMIAAVTTSSNYVILTAILAAIALVSVVISLIALGRPFC